MCHYLFNYPWVCTTISACATISENKVSSKTDIWRLIARTNEGLLDVGPNVARLVISHTLRQKFFWVALAYKAILTCMIA